MLDAFNSPYQDYIVNYMDDVLADPRGATPHEDTLRRAYWGAIRGYLWQEPCPHPWRKNKKRNRKTSTYSGVFKKPPKGGDGGGRGGGGGNGGGLPKPPGRIGNLAVHGAVQASKIISHLLNWFIVVLLSLDFQSAWAYMDKKPWLVVLCSTCVLLMVRHSVQQQPNGLGGNSAMYSAVWV